MHDLSIVRDVLTGFVEPAIVHAEIHHFLVCLVARIDICCRIWIREVAIGVVIPPVGYETGARWNLNWIDRIIVTLPVEVITWQRQKQLARAIRILNRQFYAFAAIVRVRIERVELGVRREQRVRRDVEVLFACRNDEVGIANHS